MGCCERFTLQVDLRGQASWDSLFRDELRRLVWAPEGDVTVLSGLHANVPRVADGCLPGLWVMCVVDTAGRLRGWGECGKGTMKRGILEL